MKSKWFVERFYQGKPDSREFFKTREDALAFYTSQVSAMRFGLVGWSVSYPKEFV